MATTAVTARQYPLSAIADLGIANIGAAGVNGITINVPRGALVTNIGAVVYTPFNSGTATTLSATDGTTTFISAEDAKAAAHTVIAVDAKMKFYPNGGTITFFVAETGTTATAGRILGFVDYVVLNRQNEQQF